VDRSPIRFKAMLIGVGLLGGLLSGALIFGGLGSTAAVALAAKNDPLLSVADVAERSLDSVVNISTTRRPSGYRSPFHELFRQFGQPMPSPRAQHALGSGVIISADGVVVTNNHVVKDATSIKVTVGSSKREYNAKVVGTDPKSDVAVLRLQGAKGLKAIRVGDSDKLRLGEVVVAIGNPFGVGQTVTMGIVSAKGRANMGIVDYEDFIQTDAAINPGNSGGALINMHGELVGINTAILSRTGGYQGIGFAIPTNMVQPIVQSLLKRGRVVRGWLGVSIQEVNRELAKALKLPTTEGVLVSDVEPGSPAQKAGLKRGDLIVRLNGKPVRSTARLRNLVAAAGAGASVRLELYRDGHRSSLAAHLTELPARLGGGVGGAGGAEGQPAADLGLQVDSVRDAALRQKFNIPSRLKYGVVVVGLDPSGAAAQAGLQPGDVILEVNRARMDGVRRFSQILRAARGDILFLIYRQGTTLYVMVDR
jgi:serine protease Do